MAKINEDVVKVLTQCWVEGHVVKLPAEQMEKQLYNNVKRELERIGGKWKGGKVFGFVFEEDPTKHLAHICTGEVKNLKKEYQFFATPPDLAKELVDLAEVTHFQTILEPSAGDGAIIKQINLQCDARVDYCEIMPLNRMKLEQADINANYIYADFLDPAVIYLGKYDRIIANPPFSNNQDMEHIMQMAKMLKPGGRIVTIASKHWEFNTNFKEVTFKLWLQNMKAQVIPIDSGRFKESGTMVSTCIIIINCP